MIFYSYDEPRSVNTHIETVSYKYKHIHICQPIALLSIVLTDTVSTVSVAFTAWSRVAVLHAASADCLQLSRHNHLELA